MKLSEYFQMSFPSPQPKRSNKLIWTCSKVGDYFMELIEPVAAFIPYMTCPGNHGKTTLHSVIYTQYTLQESSTQHNLHLNHHNNKLQTNGLDPCLSVWTRPICLSVWTRPIFVSMDLAHVSQYAYQAWPLIQKSRQEDSNTTHTVLPCQAWTGRLS